MLQPKSKKCHYGIAMYKLQAIKITDIFRAIYRTANENDNQVKDKLI